MQPYALHWFRRDLRLAGNPALQASFERHAGRVVGVFCFDKAFLARTDFSARRFQFFLESLEALRAELESMGSGLLFKDIGPEAALPQLVRDLEAKTGLRPAAMSWNRDYEPYAQRRDQGMRELCQGLGISVHTERDHQLIEPEEIRKESDPTQPYQVYTPYSRQWYQVFQSAAVQTRVQAQQAGLRYLEKRAEGAAISPPFNLRWSELLGAEAEMQSKDLLADYRVKNQPQCNIALPAAGSLAAWQSLQVFKPVLARYHQQRDLPAVSGTSRLSIYYKNGSLSIAQTIAALGLHPGLSRELGPGKFLAELVWREFYVYILSKFPRVEHEAFQARYKDLAFENREDYFAAWCEGKTGYPIVDAGMRELNTTGWMHNRVRMIVASFLTKDLLIDWRWGEGYFMQQLLDGDLAPNNGGWQWAASTGVDAQPYFRIFNPGLQSQKFDSEGTYIKTHVPELRDCPAAKLHQPGAGGFTAAYPAAIVDHAVQRGKALALYSAANPKK